MFGSLLRLLLLATLVGCTGTGCTGTAVPQPPGLSPVDPMLVATTPELDTPSVTGGPGSVLDIEGAEVWIWNLENALAPVRTSVATDGSFTAMVEHTEGDELRLQVRTADNRSAPVDIIAPAGAAVRPDCLDVRAELPLGDSRVAELSIDNRCTFEVSVQSVVLRVGEPALVVSGPDMARLPSGSNVLVTVRADGVGPVEDILFVFADLEGEVVRYPVTVFATD